MKIKVLFFLFILVQSITFAQPLQTKNDELLERENLLFNYSFEQYDYCPEYYTQDGGDKKFMPYWIQPTKGTPDYFNTCSTGGVSGVPENFAGSSNPKTGKGYVGIIVIGSDRSPAKENTREYIQSEMRDAMEKDVWYCVSFWYKLSSSSKFAIDALGVLLSDRDISLDPIRKDINTALNFNIPQVLNKGKVLDNKDEWQQVCQLYKAKGNERFFVLGNFNMNADTKIAESTTGETVNKRGKEYSYYYIDDVKVIRIQGETCKICECVPADLAVTPKTEGRSLALDINGGTKPYKVEWITGDTAKKLTKIPSGWYSYKVTDMYGCSINDSTQYIAPQSNFQVKHQSEYKGGSTGCIELMITGGIPPYVIKWSNDSTKQKICGLEEGVYLYTVTDDNGEKRNGKVVFKDKFKQELENISEGGRIALKNINFDLDKTDLLPESYIELDKVVEFMHEQDIKQVQIAGHTDTRDSDEHNLKLSDGRAKSVVDYLISKGIDKERMTSKGYGETQLLVKVAKTEDEHRKNRRVEFIILKK